MTEPAASTPDAPHSTLVAPRLRLEFLDGLRGIAALYVVLFHAAQLSTLDDRFIDPLLVWRLGHPAVSVFIVLSGFSLMLPIARSGLKELRGGTASYFKRRAWRVLPPYYAALILSICFLAVAHAAKYHHASAFRDKTISVQLSSGSLLSHLLLVHNFSSVWTETIDVPMWSVATEWQIYFFLPALLLPVWRRFGIWAMIAAGFSVGLLPHYLLTPAANFDWACPWYLGLFATGMAGAVVAFPSTPSAWMRQLPWGIFAGILFGILGVLIVMVPDAAISNYVWETDALAGTAALCLILSCTRLVTHPKTRRSVVLRVLEARPALWLGLFSYSLYLVHYPILNKAAQVLALSHLPLDLRLILIYATGVPLAVGLSYLFHLAVEKRLMERSAASHLPEVTFK